MDHLWLKWIRSKKMKKLIEEIYVYVDSVGPDQLMFTVRFPDGCEKDYKISGHEFRSTRCSVRDFIEQKISEFYENLNKPTPPHLTYFS
jgi:hypothetical protein